MTKIKKVVLFAIFSLTLTFGACSGTFSSCSCSGKGVQKPNYVALNVEEYSLTIGDELILSMDYELDRDETFEYSSSNEKIATVDENGKVVGVGIGKATITVTYGDASDSCEVTVGAGNALAYLEYDALSEDEKFYVSLNDSVSLVPRVSFNGKSYDDATVEYVLSDDSVGEVKNGEFKAKSLGETEVYVSATWRGMSGETLTKTISVEVVNDVQIFINNGADSSLTLYTKDTAKIPVMAGAYENGAPIADVEMELITDGEDCVTYDGDALQSKGVAGETALLVSCVDSQGKKWEKTFKVTVTQTVLTYEGTLTGFSAMDGDFVGDESFLKVLGGKVVKAERADGTPLTVEDGKVYGVETSKKGLTQTQIIVYSNQVGYKINLEGYTGIIDEAEDLAWFGVKNDGYKTNSPNYKLNSADRGYTDLAQRQDGYYILGKDIDASEYTQPAGGSNLTSSADAIRKLVAGIGGIGLTGTFDGQGHTIRGLTTGSFGLFGIVYGGTLKNVAFTQVKVSGNYASPFAQYLINATLEDVYLQVDSLSGTSVGALASAIVGSSFKGVIIECDSDAFENAKTSYGSLTYLAYKERGTSGYEVSVFNGAYVISPTACTNYNVGNVSKEYVVDAEGRGARYTYTGLKRYDTQADFEAAGESFGSFSATYWDKSGATPVWKTKDFVPEEEPEVDEPVEDTSGVGSFNPDWLNG